MKPTETTFLKDVKNHTMEVLLDNGVYRHLRFTNKGSFVMWFDIVTWPGYLAYSGDMGCFVFARLEDMFQFFRTDARHAAPDTLGINLSYWGEKLEAVDRDGYDSAHKEFNSDLLRKRVKEYLEEWIDDYELKGEVKADLIEAVEDEVLSRLEDGEHYARKAVSDFSYKNFGHTFEFTDSWEWECKEYTYRFIWCCYALAWAIKQYDSFTAQLTQPELTELL